MSFADAMKVASSLSYSCLLGCQARQEVQGSSDLALMQWPAMLKCCYTPCCAAHLATPRRYSTDDWYKLLIECHSRQLPAVFAAKANGALFKSLGQGITTRISLGLHV
jgi:hypothetical protein